MPYQHIQQGVCFRCWGSGTDPQDGADWSLVQNVPKADLVRYLSRHLNTVKQFGTECGQEARDNLMRLYEQQGRRFLRAVASIEAGRQQEVAQALAAWAAEAADLAANQPAKPGSPSSR